MDALAEYLSVFSLEYWWSESVKPKKDKEEEEVKDRPLFAERSKKLQFKSSSELRKDDVRVMWNDEEQESEKENENGVLIPEDLLPNQRMYLERVVIICRSLFDQLKENKKCEEDELAERRKLMYGVRPMDDEEYKDYEQMEIARRERERLNREKMEYEERQFRWYMSAGLICRGDAARHLVGGGGGWRFVGMIE